MTAVSCTVLCVCEEGFDRNQVSQCKGLQQCCFREQRCMVSSCTHVIKRKKGWVVKTHKLAIVQMVQSGKHWQTSFWHSGASIDSMLAQLGLVSLSETFLPGYAPQPSSPLTATPLPQPPSPCLSPLPPPPSPCHTIDACTFSSRPVCLQSYVCHCVLLQSLQTGA